MADEMIFLTPQDVTVLRQLKELLDSSPGDWTQPYPEDVPSPYLDASQGAEVYLVRVPEGGIPAAYTQSNATGTNSIYDYLIPGTAECRVLHWVEDPELGAAGDGRFAALDGFSHRVYNVGFEDVEGGIWALAAKVKDGVFIFVGGVSTSSTGTGTDGGDTPVILGCYLKRDVLNRITLNLDQLIGEGLEVGTTGGCPAVHIKLNAGCHITITTPTMDDPVTRIGVDVSSLTGDTSETGLKPYDGAACTPISNDYVVNDGFTEQFLRLTDSRLLRIGDNLTQVNLWDLEEFYYNAAHELIDHAIVNTVLRINVINLCCDASGTGTGTGTGSPSHNYCIAYLQGEAGSELDGGWPYIAPFCIVMTEDDAAFLLGEGFQVVGPFDTPDECQLVCGAGTGTGSPASMWYCLYDPESQEQGCFDLTSDELFEALEAGFLYTEGPFATSGECACCGASELLIDAGGSPTSADVDEDIEFTATPTGGVMPYTYLWDFDDDSTGTEQNPTHHFAEAGEYEVVLTVTDACGRTVMDDSVVVTVNAEGITTACCSDNPLPTTLTVTFGTGASQTACLSGQSVALAWNGSAWVGTSATCDGPNGQFVITLACTEGAWAFSMINDVTCALDAAPTGTCSPLNLTGTASATLSCAGSDIPFTITQT